MDKDITTLEDLYNKLLPVLKTKVNEMKLRRIDYINEIDLWNYNTEKWKKTTNLSLSDMVSDILNTSDKVYEQYKKETWKE